MTFRQKAVEWYKKSRLFAFFDGIVSRRARKRLKNDRFSIICSGCVGGFISHRFGKQFLSPTVNMFIPNNDFVSFVTHLDYFLSLDPLFVRSNRPYPVAVLTGNGADIRSVRLFFNHSKTEEEALADWNRRKARIDPDNLYLIMYDLDGVTKDDLNRIAALPKEKWKNKVIFTARSLPEIDWSVRIRPVMTDAHPYFYLQRDLFGRARFERHFDAAAFLNGEDASHFRK